MSLRDSILRIRPDRATRTLLGVAALAFSVGFSATAVPWPLAQRVSFNEEVRPILNEKCIACHGGVKRSGGFGVLFREDALAKTESGAYGIVPGDADASELFRRIVHSDPSERMPKDAPPLSEDEIRILERWIEQGAEWEDHWAYIPPERPRLPRVEGEAWVRGGIDRFVLARLEEEALRPSPAASCATLIRRVSLDVIGLPARPEQVAEFCRAPTDAAYVRYVDELLASPRYGEHWASMWMDLARYADTKGYERDAGREIWRYRDWVIDAFNQDLPYDRFTVEQLAGDLLPDATDRQVLATAFHRNSMTNDEGGTDDEEFRVAAVIDRVNTTWEVWQGTTMACVQCHSHPYDPFRHEDYYRSFAYFNNTADADWKDEYPRLPAWTDEQRRELSALLGRVPQGHPATSRGSLSQRVEGLLYPEGRIPGSTYAHAMGVRSENEHYRPVEQGAYARYDDLDLRGVESITFGYQANGEGGTVEIREGGTDGRLLGTARLSRSGRGTEEVTRASISPPTARGPVTFVLNRIGKGSYVIHWFALHDPRAPEVREVEERIAAVSPEGDTPVLAELPPGHRRATRVFERGNWLVQGDTVLPGVPRYMAASAPASRPDRLGFASWLVSPQNPLTARVAVNRMWAQLFGIGIVETLEDFGTQGAAPSHPELLDWLAVRFRDDLDWSMKALLKEIVTSSTYRQSSRLRPELLRADPYNRLMARGPRFRLSAEQIRDQALAISGLLSEKMGGPSVMPPQPPGLWDSPYNSGSWEPDHGEDRYRRAVYTYWKRTVPYPSVTTFDAPTREVAVSRRIRTNTPLQALVTLNDPVYVEAAQALARTMSDVGGRPGDRVRFGYRRALGVDPDPETQVRLLRLYRDAARKYRERPELLDAAVQPYMPYDTAAVAAGSDYEQTETASKAEVPTPAWAAEPVRDSLDVAALTTVASVILNLDSFLTKE